jgi:hypothetical protein
MLGLVSATAGFVVVAAPATGQEDPEIVQAREKLQQAQEEANAAHDRYQKAVEERDQVQDQIAQLERAIPEMRAREAELRAQLSTRAAALYKNTDPSAGFEVLTARNHIQAGRRTKLTEAADDFDNERARQLRETADQLAQAQRDLEAKQAQLEELLPRLEQEKAAFDQRVAAANRALEVAEEIGALRALGEPVMGPTVLTAQEIAAWYRSSGASPRLSGGMSIDELAQIYVDEGTAENVRADFAFAQSYIETGGFRAGGSDNNFSGLGACDSCSGETRFPTARDGGARPDPAPPQLRRSPIDCVRPAQPAVAVLVWLRPVDGGEELRHVLCEGVGADVADDGPRQLGDRPELCGEGHRRLQPHDPVARRLTRCVPQPRSARFRYASARGRSRAAGRAPRGRPGPRRRRPGWR